MSPVEVCIQSQKTWITRLESGTAKWLLVFEPGTSSPDRVPSAVTSRPTGFANLNNCNAKRLVNWTCNSQSTTSWISPRILDLTVKESRPSCAYIRCKKSVLNCSWACCDLSEEHVNVSYFFAAASVYYCSMTIQPTELPCFYLLGLNQVIINMLIGTRLTDLIRINDLS